MSNIKIYCVLRADRAFRLNLNQFFKRKIYPPIYDASKLIMCKRKVLKFKLINYEIYSLYNI